MAEPVAPVTPVTRVAGAGTRWLSVVVGSHRYDVVVDEHLLVSEVLALVQPDRELAALTMSDETVPLDETVALAHLETGTMLLTAPVEVTVPSPRLHPTPERGADGIGLPAAGGARSAMLPGGGSEPDPSEPVSGGALPALGTPGGSSSRRRLGYVAGSPEGSGDGPGPGGTAGGHGGPLSVRPTGRMAGALVTRGQRGRRGQRGQRGSRAPGLGEAVPIGGGRPASVARPAATVLVAALLAALAVAGSVLASAPGARWAQAVSLALVAIGLVLVQIWSGPRLLRLCAPLLGAAGGAGAAGVLSDGPVVVVVGGCAGAALVALAGRAGTGRDRYVPRVWIAFAGGIGALGLLALLAGMPLPVLATVALAAVVLLGRVVPDLVIDVDDDVLIDIGRLSVTSWSPRESRRPRRPGWRIDDEAVGSVVAAASVEQVATLVGLAAVSTGGSAVLFVGLVRSAVPSLAMQLLLGAAGLALSLTARAYRRRGDRTLLRFAALAPALALAVAGLTRLGSAGGGGIVVGAAGVVLALALASVAPALGRGYRSLWASRLADIAELLALVAVLPLALWAAGLVERAMGLFA